MNHNNYSNENKYISLAEASQLCSYSQEYLGLRARQGKLGAVKVGRDWMTTELWLSDYISEIGTKTDTKRDNDQNTQNAQKMASQHISLREAAIDSPYSQDYLSLRVRQGKLRAVKHGRNWVTKKEWVDEYVKSVGGTIAAEKIIDNIPVCLDSVRLEKPELGAENKIFTDSTFLSHQAETKERILLVEKKFTEASIRWLDLSVKKGISSIDKIKKLAVRLNLKYKALDENLRILQVAPGLADNSVKYLRAGVLTALLISGACFLSQSQTGTKLSRGAFDALAKTGQVVVGVPENLLSFQNKISAVPMKIVGAGDVLSSDVKESGRIISQASRESASQTSEIVKLFIWQGQKAIVSLAVGSAKLVSVAPSTIKNWQELSSALNEKIISQILILPDQAAGVFSRTQERLAAIGQFENNLLASGQNFFVGWPEKIKNFYIGLDNNNEKIKNQITQATSRGSNNVNLAIDSFVKKLSVSNAFSFTYDKYLTWSKKTGHAINDGVQVAYQSLGKVVNVPEKIAVWTGNKLGTLGGIAKQKISVVNRNLAFIARRVGLTLSRATNFLAVNFTQYGRLENNIGSLFGKNIAQAPTFSPWQTGNIPFEEINQLQNEVNQMKIAMEEIKFNLAIGQEAKLISEVAQPQPQYIISQGGQLTQNITQVQNITQNLPASDYAKAGDLVATETRLFNMISTLQSGAVSQSNNYTTNNFYSWASSQRIDNLGSVTIAGVSLTGSLLQTGNGRISFSGNVSASNGLSVSGNNFTVGGTSFVVDNSGNLDMAGNLTISGDQTLLGDLTIARSSYLGSSISTSTLTVKGPSTLTVSSTTEALYVTQYGIGAGIVVNASSSTSTLAVYQNGAGTALDIFQNNVAGNLIRLQNATGTLFLINGFGQVTLGTTTADTTVYGKNITAQLGDDNSLYNFILKNFSGSDLLTINSGGNLTLTANATSSIFSDVAFDTNTLYIDSINNSVGIGTSSPFYKLSVEGIASFGDYARASYFVATSSTATSTFAGGLSVDTNGLVYDWQTNRIGIGIATPLTSFHISATDGLVIPVGTTLQRPSSLVGGTIRYNNTLLQFEGYDGTYWGSLGGVIDVDRDTKITAEDSAGADNDQLKFSTAGSERMRIDLNGYVGIGTTTPYSLFSISNSVSTAPNTPLFTIASTTAGTATSTHLTVLANGSVGIGTAVPTQLLEINKSQNSATSFYVINPNTSGNAARSYLLMGSSDTGGNYGYLGYFNASYADAGSIYKPNRFILEADGAATNGLSLGALSATGYMTFYTGGEADSYERMRITSAGNVGIGTTSPFEKLSVAGNIYAEGTITASGFIATSSISATYFIATDATATSTFAGGLAVDTNGLVFDWQTNNVGIGTASPAYKLDVNGIVNSTGLYVNGSPYLGSQWTTLDSNIYYTTGNVGVGTTSPFAKLSVNGAAGGTIPLFAVASSTSAYATSTVFLIDANGNVGVGTTSPGYKLDVNGIVNSTGLYVNGSPYIGSQWTTLDSNIYYTTGNVGVGTTSPVSKFAVLGTSTFSGDVLSGVDNAYDIGTSTQRWREINVASNGSGGIKIWKNTGVNYEKATLAFSDAVRAGVLTLSTDNAGIGFERDIQIKAGAAVGIYLNSSGNVGIGYTNPNGNLAINGIVGIGTTTPTSHLDVFANGRATDDMKYGLRIVNTDMDFSQTTRIGLIGNNSNKFVIGTDFNSNNTNDFFIATSTNTTGNAPFGITSEGQIKIGNTQVPASTNNKLYAVAGDLFWNSISLAGELWSRTGSNTYLSEVGDFVSIGTSTPYAKLTVWGQGNTVTSRIIEVTDSASTTLFTILGNGNVGIGTSSPSVKKLAISGGFYATEASLFGSDLQVDGVLNVDGNFSVNTNVLTIDSATGDITSNGTAWFKADLKVNGNATTTGILNIGGALKVGGNFDLIGNATITGTATSTGNLGTTGDFYALGNITTSGVFRASGGSQILPSYTFNSDLNTGLFSVAADKLAFTTGGAERARIDDVGNFGIGTTSPYSLLSISNSVSTVANTPLFTIASTTAGTATSTLLTVLANGNMGIGLSSPTSTLAILGDFHAMKTGGAEGLFFNSFTGNVGIGTSSPLAKLSIQGYSGMAGNLLTLASSTGATIFDVDSAGLFNSYATTGTSTIVSNLNVQGQIKIGTDSMYLTSTGFSTASGNMSLQPGGGNVGIGTTSPFAKLSITSATGAQLILAYDDTKYSSLTTDSNGLLTIAGNNNTNGNVYVDTGSKFGVGTSTPDSTVSIMAGASESPLYIVNSSNAVLMRMDSTGNVGIGTAAPGYTLTVIGTSWTTNNAWAGSDARWKTNVQPVASALDKVMQLTGVSYNWRQAEFPENRFDDKTHLGFIAQDVESVVPELVTTGPDGYKGLDYNGVASLLAASIKELNTKVNLLSGSSTIGTYSVNNYFSTSTPTYTTINQSLASSTITDYFSTLGNGLISMSGGALGITNPSQFALASGLSTVAEALADTQAVVGGLVASPSYGIGTSSIVNWNLAYSLANTSNAILTADTTEGKVLSIINGAPTWVATSTLGFSANASITTNSYLADFHQNVFATSSPNFAGLTITGGNINLGNAGIGESDIANWNRTVAQATTTYAWGNHASAGYLTSFTEIDPLFSASPASSLLSSDIAKWNTLSDRLNSGTEGKVLSYKDGAPTWVATSTLGIIDNHNEYQTISNYFGSINETGNTTVGNLIPTANNTYNIGSATNKFANIYGQNIIAGDLVFTESTYAVSGDTILAGDTMALYVSAVNGDTHTVPIDFRTAINNANYGSGKVTFNTTGNVGIGTTNPTGKLHIYTSAPSGDGRMLTLQNLQATGNLSYNLSIVPSTGDLTLSSNDNSQGSLINNVYSAWSLNLNGANDSFSIKRSGSGAMSYVDFLRVTSAGNIGIGSSTPSSKFAVAGSAYIEGTITTASLVATSTLSAPYFTATSATATSTLAGGLAVDTNGLVYDWNTNNVGIGTASPAYNLDVSGTLRATGNVVLGDLVSGDLVTFNSRINTSLIPSADNNYDLGDGTNWLRWRTGYFGTSVGIGGTATSTGVDLLANGAYLINSGSTLSVNTTSNQPVTFGSGQVTIPYASSTATTVSGTASTTNLYISGNAYISPTTQGSIFFAGANGLISQNNTNLNWNNSTNLLTVLGNASTTQLTTTGSVYFATDGGNVGIGTSSPASKLDVWGDLRVGTSATPALFINSTTGNVGIGTTSPFAKLSITSATGAQLILAYDDTKYSSLTTDSNGLLTIAGNNNTNGNVYVDTGSKFGVGTSTPDSTVSIMAGASESPLYIVNSSNAVLMRMDSTGNVGIGTAGPSRKLFVSGDAGGTAAWSNDSHSSYKENFSDIAVLDKIARLNIKEWQYKPEHLAVDSSRHISPFAEDFRMQFGLGQSDYTIQSLDVAGVALKGVQELNVKANLLSASSTASFDALGSGLRIINNEGRIIFSGNSEMGVLPNREMRLSANTILLDGSVGIGTSTPQARLDVWALAGSSGDVFNVASSSGESFFKIDYLGSVGIGTSTPSAGSGIKVAVGGDIGATGFVNLSTRDSKKDIEYLGTVDYEKVLEKISENVKPATYSYNSDQTEKTTSSSNRLGLIAEEAPLEVLSADGKGVDLYKLATFTLMGVKALDAKVNNQQLAISSLEARVSALEESVSGLRKSDGLAKSTDLFQQALETLGGEKIELAPSSILALSNNLYSSVLSAFKSLGLVVEKGMVRVQKLIADTLQLNKLVVNTAPQTDASGETKDPTIGSAQINVNELNTYIINNQVSTTTKIFVTPETPVALGICETHEQETLVDNVMRPQGFRVCMSATSTQIVKFSWWIVETTADSRGFDAAINAETTSPSPSPYQGEGWGGVSPSSSASPTPTPSIPTSDIPNIEAPASSDIGSPSVESPLPSATASPSPSPSETPAPSPTETPTE